jgi:hypothetical protein
MSAFHFILGNQDKFLGRGARNEEGMAILKALLPMEEDSTRRAVARKVKLVLGTDSVAGMHGQNSEEFIYRVIDGGQKPMDAIISGTSLAAESLGMSDRIGAHRSWPSDGPGGDGRKSGGGHHCRQTSGFRDEGRKGL